MMVNQADRDMGPVDGVMVFPQLANETVGPKGFSSVTGGNKHSRST